MTDNTLKMFIFFFHLTCFILKYEWNTSKLLACNVKSLLTGCWLNSTAFKCLWRKQFPLHLPWYKCESSPSVGWPPWCAACATSGRSALTCGFHTLSLQESSLYKGSGKPPAMREMKLQMARQCRDCLLWQLVLLSWVCQRFCLFWSRRQSNQNSKIFVAVL